MSQTQHFCGVGTTIERPDAHTIRGLYRGTCVAQLQSTDDGRQRTVRLNHGGWKTATTKMRMNQFANEFCNGEFAVVQEKGEWFVLTNPELSPSGFGKRTVFHTQTIVFTL
jgi:hypothetical protein